MPKKKNPTIAKIQTRVRNMEARKIESGARRMPGGLLQPEAAQAVESLLASGFAPNITHAINRALIECAARITPQQ